MEKLTLENGVNLIVNGVQRAFKGLSFKKPVIQNSLLAC